jgi:hypothetical protein
MGYKTMGYRKLYNKFAGCNCGDTEGAEPTQLPSAINFGMPASLTDMEGEGMGYKTMGYRRKLYNKFAGCDCGESEGEGEGEGGAMGYKTMGYRKLYNKFADCNCGDTEGAEPTQLPSAINVGMPASLTGMEGEGEGGGMGYKTMGYRRMLRGSN